MNLAVAFICIRPVVVEKFHVKLEKDLLKRIFCWHMCTAMKLIDIRVARARQIMCKNAGHRQQSACWLVQLLKIVGIEKNAKR